MNNLCLRLVQVRRMRNQIGSVFLAGVSLGASWLLGAQSSGRRPQQVS